MHAVSKIEKKLQSKAAQGPGPGFVLLISQAWKLHAIKCSGLYVSHLPHLILTTVPRLQGVEAAAQRQHERAPPGVHSGRRIGVVRTTSKYIVVESVHRKAESVAPVRRERTAHPEVAS